MPLTIPSNLKTPQPYIGYTEPGSIAKQPGVPLHFPDLVGVSAASAAYLTANSVGGLTSTGATQDGLFAAVAVEKVNISLGFPVLTNGQQLRNESEPGVVRKWLLGSGGDDAAKAAASNARQISIGSQFSYTLASDTAKVIVGTGTATGGNNSDLFYLTDAATVWLKTAGIWALLSNVAGLNFSQIAAAIKGRFGGASPAVSRWIPWGDSWSAQSMSTSVAPTAYNVTSGVMTINFTGHGLYNGAKLSVTGAALDAQNVIQAPVTVVDANTITVPAPGAPNGAVTGTKASLQVVQYDRMGPQGILTQLYRLSNGGITCPNVAGFPGYGVPDIVSEFQRSVAAYSPDVVLILEGMNSIANMTEDDLYAAIVSQIDLVNSIGAICLVTPIGPWSSGAAENTLANRVKAESLKRRIQAYCEGKPLAHLLRITDLARDPATGLGRTGWIDASGRHPAHKMSYALAKLALAAVPRIKPRLLVSCADDSRAVDSASLNVARSMPAASTGGGLATGGNINLAWTSGGTVTTGQIITGGTTSPNLYYVSAGGVLGATAPSHTTGSAANGAATLDYAATTSAGNYTSVAAGIAANWTVTSVSMTSGSGAGWVEPAPDGVGFAQVARWYSSGTGQSGRITLPLTTTDFTPGETIDVYFKAKISTAHAPSGVKTLAGQNVTIIQSQMVFTVDGTTFTPNDQRSAVLVSEMIDEDLTDITICMPNLVVPNGTSLTLARLDLLVFFGGAGTAQAYVWRADVRKRA